MVQYELYVPLYKVNEFKEWLSNHKEFADDIEKAASVFMYGENEDHNKNKDEAEPRKEETNEVDREEKKREAFKNVFSKKFDLQSFYESTELAWYIARNKNGETVYVVEAIGCVGCKKAVFKNGDIALEFLSFLNRKHMKGRE